MQAHAKTTEGSQHADRDAQFRYLNEQTHEPGLRPAGDQRGHQKEGARRRVQEQRRRWRPAGDPVPVSVHDFADPQLGKAIPYGIYALAEKTGWVNVGTDHDTSAFAPESIRRWWHGQSRWQSILPLSQIARLVPTSSCP
ncbi:hypothetical protein [Streptomyces sp. ISL-44]|uniref:ISAzo13-like element transposase-related protein n=1 Tax=Streptomyces sp. ISL-44 TaxID=2819184 RepID=UPI002035AF8C|nr:hypothetical protein [Streptomyces sp. ISL-44]